MYLLLFTTWLNKLINFISSTWKSIYKRKNYKTEKHNVSNNFMQEQKKIRTNTMQNICARIQYKGFKVIFF